MSALRQAELELLDFLCAVHENPHCRIKQVKGSCKMPLRRLRWAGLVRMESFDPSPWALHDWNERRSQRFTIRTGPGAGIYPIPETPAEAPGAEPTVPPEPEAARDGGGDARKVAPPPTANDITSVIADVAFAFGDRAPKPKAKRKGPPSMAERARRFEEQRNTRGASGVEGGGRERAPADGAKDAAVPNPRIANGPGHERKRRTPDTAASTVPSTEGPHPLVDPSTPSGLADESAAVAGPIGARSPLEEPRVVDIKVNRDPTERPPGYGEEAAMPGPGSAWASVARDRNRKTAEERLDRGETPEQQNSVSMRINMRQVLRDRESAERAADPIEQAKLLIRRKTHAAVFAAEVTLGENGAGKFYVGRQLMTQPELLAYAKRLESAR